jgi:hypothetical protein
MTNDHALAVSNSSRHETVLMCPDRSGAVVDAPTRPELSPGCP